MMWFDGQLTENAQIESTNAGFTSGWGVFTTLAIRGGAPILWDYHAARLQRDAEAARVEFCFGENRLNAGLMRLIGETKISDGLARITGVRRGDGRWNSAAGAHWNIIVQAAVAASSAPLRLEVSPFRVAARAPLAGVKTTSYLPYFHAWETARERGFDEALLLTERELICESARATIFWAKDGTIYTPSLDCGCLRGVGRAVILENFAVQQGRYELADLWEADEALLISGATGARAIGSFSDESRARKWEGTGALTRTIQQFFGAHGMGEFRGI